MASAQALRLRLTLLVAALAALASVATSESAPNHGITDVGTSVGGAAYAGRESYVRFQSADGGSTWVHVSTEPSGITWGGESAETPRGRLSPCCSDRGYTA